MQKDKVRCVAAITAALFFSGAVAQAQNPFARVSSSLDGGPWIGDATGGVVSPDGSVFAWYNLGALFELNIPPGRVVDWNVYVYYADRDELVPANIDHEGLGVAATRPSISDKGRFVAFVGADRKKIYLRDMEAGKTTWINSSMDGAELNAQSHRPLISADGSLVAYSTDATNIIPGDTNGVRDVLIYHRLTGETTFGMLNSEGKQFAPTMTLDSEFDLSADGRFLFFSTTAAGVHPDTPPLFATVYRRNLSDGTVELVSRNAEGEVASGTYTTPRSSYDGGSVAMTGLGVGAFGKPIIAGYSHFFGEFYAKNLETGMVWRVSNTLDGKDVNGLVTGEYDISGDGTLVAFGHSATNLSASKTIKNRPDLFLASFDGDAFATVTHLSRNSAGLEFASEDGHPRFAKKANVLAFTSEAWYELMGDNGSGDDVQIMAYRPDGANTGGGNSDFDPTYDSWLSGFNLQGADADYTQDPDGDRISNLLEFVFATNPADGETGSPIAIRRLTVNGQEYPAVSFPQRVDLGNVQVNVEVSGSLAFDNLMPVIESNASAPQNGVIQKSFRIDQSLKEVKMVFFRIVVSAP